MAKPDPLGLNLSLRSIVAAGATAHRATVADLVAMRAVRRCWAVAGDIDLIVEIWETGMALLNAARARSPPTLACDP